MGVVKNFVWELIGRIWHEMDGKVSKQKIEVSCREKKFGEKSKSVGKRRIAVFGQLLIRTAEVDLHSF